LAGRERIWVCQNESFAASGGSAFSSSGNPQLALWAKFRRCFAASNWLEIAIDAGGMGNDPVTKCDRIRAECSMPSIRFTEHGSLQVANILNSKKAVACGRGETEAADWVSCEGWNEQMKEFRFVFR